MRNETDGRRWQRQLLVLTLVAVGFGIVALGTVPTAAVADHANTTDDRIQIVDAQSSFSGNTVVVVRATTDEPVSKLQFTYDNGTEVGPLTLDNGGVTSAEYNDGPSFSWGDTFSDDGSGNPTVEYTLNQSWEPSEVELNASAGNTAYESADSANRSVLTTNVYNISLQNASGGSVTAFTPVEIFNDSSSTHLDYAFVNGGSHSFHCGGVYDGSTCDDPETDGETHVYSKGTSTTGSATALPTTVSVRAFGVASGNGSEETTLSGDHTLSLTEPTAAVEYVIRDYSRGSVSDLQSIALENRTTGDVVARWDSGFPTTPLFVSPKTDYDLVINRSGGVTERRPITFPTKGLRTEQIFVEDSATARSEVIGQVINESGDPVSGVTVTAEPVEGSTNAPPAFNSTTTDENGLFSMELPESEAVEQSYQFRLVSSQTDNGTLSYFPTRDAGDNQGYRVFDSRAIVGQLEIQQGGEVDINVTNASGGSIASPQALTSLSETTTKTGDRTRDALVEGISLFSFSPTNTINQTVVRVPSPTTGPQDDVSYNVWGLDRRFNINNELCAEQVTVSQGDRTNSDCQLESSGTLNISLDQTESLLETGPSSSVKVDSYENVLIVRNASSGNVTTYFGPGSIQGFIVESDEEDVLSLPVPAGNYTVEIRPRNQFIDRTSVRNETVVEVSSGGSGDAILKSGRDFGFALDSDRTDSRFQRTTDNTVAIQILDPKTRKVLNGSTTNLNASLRLFHQNGTVAGPPASLSYNDTADSFDNTSFTPTVDAGVYIVQLKATYKENNSSYNSTVRDGFVVSDFATDLWTIQDEVDPGEPFTARVRAYDLTTDPPTALGADSNNITLTLYNRDGVAIDAPTTASSGFTDGDGTIQVPGITEPGEYRIGVTVESDDGRQGIASTWITVSGSELDLSLNDSAYSLTDPVNASLTLRDSSGNPVPEATLETTVTSGGSSVTQTNTTDSNGEATILLDPKTLYSSTDSWSKPAFVDVKATFDTGDTIRTEQVSTGIPIQAFQTDVFAAQDEFVSGESPRIGVSVESDSPVDPTNVTAEFINGRDIEVNSTRVSNGFYEISLDSDLTTYDVGAQGTYTVQVEVTNDNGVTETGVARFGVGTLDLRAEPDRRLYDTSEDITVSTVVRYQNGTRASGEQVEMELVELAQSRRGEPTPVTSTTIQTNSSGQATVDLTPDSAGEHGVSVEAGGSERRFSVYVTPISAEFTDENGDPVDSYEFTPGETDATINISATNDSGPIDGNMSVVALIENEPTQLGYSEITDGTAGINFSVPESADTGRYPLGVEILSESENFGINTSSIRLVQGPDTVTVETDTRESVYEPGENATVRATVTNGSGPIPDADVTFELPEVDDENIDDGELGDGETVTTDVDGTVEISRPVPNVSDGEYIIRATAVGEEASATDAISVTDTQLSVTTNESAYSTGDTILVNISANRSGSPLLAGGGSEVVLRRPDGSDLDESIDSSDRTVGTHYEVEIDVPEADAIIGTRTIEAEIRNGSLGAAATASTTVDVFNASEDAKLSVPETIIANETAFSVTGNATVDTTGTLTVFSPGTASVTYEEQLSLNGTTDLSIADPGTYVFTLSVKGVGTETVVRNVDAGPDDPAVRVGTSLTTNETEFSDDEDIYIRTEADEMTAELFSPSGSSTVSLSLENGTTNYGVLDSSETTTGPYLVRLDGPNSTDVDSVLIEVTGE